MNIQYFRSGRCAACRRRGVERFKTFEGASIVETDALAHLWRAEPLLHAKCERRLTICSMPGCGDPPELLDEGGAYTCQHHTGFIEARPKEKK